MGSLTSDGYCIDGTDELGLLDQASSLYDAYSQNLFNTQDAIDNTIVELGLITEADLGAVKFANLTKAITAFNDAAAYYNQLQSLQSSDGDIIGSYEDFSGLVSGIENAFKLAASALALVGIVASGPAGTAIAIAGTTLATVGTIVGDISSGLKQTLGELRQAFPEESDGCEEEENPETGEDGPPGGGIDVLPRMPGSGPRPPAPDPDDLEEAEKEEGSDPYEFPGLPFDPFVLDLDGDGAELTRLGEPEVFFDYEGDSIRQMTGWVDPDDGILVRDLDGNGQIETLTELFGNATTDAYTDLATNDSNGDGAISQSDDVWTDLRVWRDLDQDGETDTGELMSMTDAGVLSISLDRETVRDVREGNLVVAEGSYTTTTGQEREAIATFLQTSETRTLADLPDDFTFDPAVFDLPDLTGTGSLFNLHIAMSQDPALLAEAQALAAAAPDMTGAAFREGFEALISSWAGVSPGDFATIPDYERAILQEILGQGAPRAQVPTVQTASYDALMDSLQLRFASQLGMLAVANAETPEESAAALEHPFFALSAFVFDPDTGVMTGSLAHALNMATAYLPRDDRSAAIEQIEKIMPMMNALRGEHYGETFNRTFQSSDYERGVWSVLNATTNDPVLKLIAHEYATAAEIETGTDGADAIEVFHDDYTVEFDRDIAMVDGGLGDDTITHVHESELFAPQRAFNTAISSYIYRAGDGNDTIDLTGAGHIIHTVYLPDIAREDAVIRAGADGESAVIAFPDGGSITFQGIENDAVQIRFVFEDGRIVGDEGIIAVSGGADNNIIDGTAADENFDGGAGNDVISGGDGSDTYHFFAGGGQDEIVEDASAPGNDVLWMRDALMSDVSVTFTGGDVTLTTSAGDSVTIRDQFAPEFAFGNQAAPRIETVRFADGAEIDAEGLQDLAFRQLNTDGDDAVIGTGINERLFFSAGDDVLSGRGGGDSYVREAGTTGDDRIEDLGGSLGDRLVIEDFARADIGFARSGNDVVLTFPDGSATTLVGQMALGGFSSIEEIEFADGETLSASELAALVNTSGSEAAIEGTGADETVTGTADDETIDGHGGNDRLEGAGGSDLYIRRAGDGDDTIADTGGADFIETDRVSFVDLNEADIAFRRTQTGDLEIETLATGEVLTVERQFNGLSSIGIEEVVFADGTSLSAADIAERAPISGTEGDDVLTGLDGDDVIVGGRGNDEMDGGAGSDIYIVRAGDGDDLIDDAAAEGEVNVLRLEGIDPSEIGVERLTDQVHNDALIRIGPAQSVRISGQFSPIDDARGVQKIVFDDGTELDRDALKAMAQVLGTDAGESLLGSVEDDIIIGGGGDDTVSGLAGDDEYRWGAGDGNDVILDDADAAARTVNTIVFTGLNSADVGLTRDGDDLVATIAGGETLTVRDQFKGSLGGSVMGVGALVFADGETLSRADLVEMFPILGTDAAERLEGGLGDDALLAGLGDDTVDGGRGADIALWRKGDGNDEVFDTGIEPAETDILKLVDVASTEATLSRGGFFYQDLDVLVEETGERISLGGHFQGGSGIEQIVFSDGMTIETADIENAPYIGSDQNDFVEAGAEDDLLIGNGGEDYLAGGAGADTYVHAPGDGGGFIDETYEEEFDFDDPDALPQIIPHNSAGDTLDLTGYSIADVSFGRGMYSDDDLLMTFADDGSQLEVVSQFAGPLSGIEHFVFDDGELSAVDVAGLVAPRDTDGTDGADELIGDFLDQTFTPGNGDDRIVTGGGRDTVVIEPGGGTDTVEGFQGGPFGTVFALDPSVFADFDAVLAAAVQTGADVSIDLGSGDTLILRETRLSDLAPENFGFDSAPILGTPDADVLNGTANADTILGDAGDDSIDARAGADTVDAGDGDDHIHHDSGDGDDIYNGGAGHDTLTLSGEAATVDLAAGSAQIGGDSLALSGIEAVTFDDADDTATGDAAANVFRLGGGADDAEGGAGGDILDGEDGDDRLEGGTGDDVVIGGAGEDAAVFSGNRADYAVREAGQTVEVEDLRGAGFDGLDTLSGIETLVFADQAVSVEDALDEPPLPVIDGTEDGERLRGTDDAEQIRGFGGDDRLIGRGGDDILEGGEGNDVLKGGTGNDAMDGGAGDDVYVVDSVDDTVTEAVSGGIDMVRSSVSFTLGENLENLRLLGEDAVDGTGNALDNRITGNDAANTLTGDIGNDRLIGRAGDDTLDGGDGNDVLKGGAGDDAMSGGAGDDIYHVDAAGDTVTESAAGGNDQVRASVTFGLGDHVERLRLTGEDAVDGLGNALDNILVGNDAANRLFGQCGDDNVNGRSGDDQLEGGCGADRLRGGDGNDVLQGGSGADWLKGGADADTFVFTAADGAYRDIVRDFELGVDMIGLSGVSVTEIAERGNHTLVSFDTGGEALLRGVEASELDLSDDFLFL